MFLQRLGALLHLWGWPVATFLLALVSGVIGFLVTLIVFTLIESATRHPAQLAAVAGVVWGALSVVPFGILLQLVDELLRARAHLLEEIARRERIEREIRHLAETDELTGLLNRRAFFARAKPLEALARRYGEPLSALTADIDRFKEINDRFGHAAGDRALVKLAHVLRGILRTTDLCARFGGDEFVVLMPHTPREGALRVAERIREALREDMDQPKFTVSIGIAVTPGTTADLERLLTLADRALYAAKNEGRDRVRVLEYGRDDMQPDAHH